MAEMEIVRQFNSELSTLYATKPPISKAKVTSITRLALKAVKYYKHVVQSLEKFVQKCRPEYKIPALYVVDSIIRQSRHQFGAEKDVFGPRFGRNITNSFQSFFKCLPEEQSKLIKVLNLWQKNKVYSPEVIQPLLNMAHTRPVMEQQGSQKLAEDVKAVPADTTQPVVGHMARRHASQQPAAVETPQEQAYIAMLQQQQEEQMKHIRELEARLQKQQEMNKQLPQPHAPQEQGGEPKFQLPTEVFAQIQALTGLVNQPGSNPPEGYAGEQYTGAPGGYEGEEYTEQYYGHQEEAYPPDHYGGQDEVMDQNYHQSFRHGYDETQQDNKYMISQQHHGFVDDFDYGDDQDDAQRIEEKKRQLKEEANRLNTSSSYGQDDTMNARQRLEEQFRQKQQMVSSIPPQAVPEIQIKQEKFELPNEPEIPVFQAEAPKPARVRSRSRSPRERKHHDSDREYRESDREHRDNEREYRDSDREKGRERDRQSESSDQSRQRSREERDRSRGDREDRDKARVDRGDRERTRVDREERERNRGDREGREKTRVDREERDRSRGDRDERDRTRMHRDERERTRVERDERERPRLDREERERPREREHGRESDKESDRERKEDKQVEEKKEAKVEKWVPPVKEGHISVCSRTIWLARINRYTTEESLQELFQEFGEVESIGMIPPRGCAYIQMAEREAAYRSLSSRQILKQNYKLAWAPAKGAKEYKDTFDKELGVSYIPVVKLQESEDTISSLAEGGWIDPRTIPESERKKEEAAAAASAANATGQPAGAPILGMPMGPSPFPGMPPGMPRIPLGMPGFAMPGMIPPGMNLPGMQFPPGMGNPFQRLPMNNRLPFMPGVNPFMMPGVMPGMPPPGATMPNMPGAPFFRGNAPHAGTPANGNQEQAGMTAQANQNTQEGESQAQQNENVSTPQAAAEFPGQTADQVPPEGQNVPDSQNGQEAQGSDQFGGPEMGPGGPGMGSGGPGMGSGGPGMGSGGPSMGSGGPGMGPGGPGMGPGGPGMGPGGPGMGPEGGPQFPVVPPFPGPGRPPFRPPWGAPPFHGRPGDQNFRGPPPFNEQSGPRGPWSDGQRRPWGHEGDPNENWSNEGGQWGPGGNNDGSWQGEHGEQWDHEAPRDRPWSRGNDRRGRRRHGNQDEPWGHEEPFDRRKRGRFDEEWVPPHDRRRGPPFDHRGRQQFGRDLPPFEDFDRQRFGPPGRGPPFPMEGPPHGRDGLPFDDIPPWKREDVRRGDRWSEGRMEEGRDGTFRGPHGFEMEQQGTGKGDNASWDRPGDGRHGNDRRDIPSLMGQPMKPLSEPQVQDIPVNVVTPDEEAKGWAEINELKARLAVNINSIGMAVNNVAKPVKEEKLSGHPEQAGVSSVQSNVTETKAPEVKQEKSKHDEVHSSAGNVEISDKEKVKDPVSVSKSEIEGKPITSDAVLEKPHEDSPVIVTDVAASHDEKTVVSEPAIESSEQGMKENENVSNVKGGNELNLIVQCTKGDETGSGEVMMGSEEDNIGSQGVKVGPVENTAGSKEVKMGSEEISVGSGVVKSEPGEGMMGYEKIKREPESVVFKVEPAEGTMGSVAVTMGSGDVKMKPDEGVMGSDEVKMKSTKVNREPGDSTMEYEDIKVEPKEPRDEVKMEPVQSSMGSEEVNVGSVESSRPENVGSDAVETGCQSGETVDNVETSEAFLPVESRDTPTEKQFVEEMSTAVPNNSSAKSELNEAVEIDQVPDSTMESKKIEEKPGERMQDVPKPIEKGTFERLQTKNELEEEIQQQDVTSSEANPDMSEVSKSELNSPSIDTNMAEIAQEATGDA